MRDFLCKGHDKLYGFLGYVDMRLILGYESGGKGCPRISFYIRGLRPLFPSHFTHPSPPVIEITTSHRLVHDPPLPPNSSRLSGFAFLTPPSCRWKTFPPSPLRGTLPELLQGSHPPWTSQSPTYTYAISFVKHVKGSTSPRSNFRFLTITSSPAFQTVRRSSSPSPAPP